MKILVVTNLYPPFYQGGYELHCAQVAEALHRAGHAMLVLTSVHGLPLDFLGNIQPRTDLRNDIRVHRRLNQYVYEPQPKRRPWTLFRAKRELQDAREFITTLDEFKPDVVNWWNMNGLTKLILSIPSLRRIPDVYSIEDNWLITDYGPGGMTASAFWTDLWGGNWGPSPLRPLFHRLGARWEKRISREGIPTRIRPRRHGHACFLSKYLQDRHREAGIEFSSSQVLYGGVKPELFFPPATRHRYEADPLRILYAGQITPARGLHTIVEAIALLDPVLRQHVTLSVAGDGHADYLSHIRMRIHASGLTDLVSFLGKVPHEQIASIYQHHDVFVFASERPEGLGFVIIEAMMAGCAVLTTGSGGAMEIANAADLPIFPKDDPRALSHILTNLVTNRAEVAKIASHGQEVALRDFGFDLMIERWNHTLQQICASQTPSTQPDHNVVARGHR